MFQTNIPNSPNSIQIEGNTLRILDQGEVVKEHTATYASETPWYSGLEEFATYCGDGFRVAVVVMDGGDRIIYLYDHRPEFYPKISDAKPEKREALEQERKEDPYLFTADGGAREWAAGNNYGYAWNVDVDYFSEWGYAPLPLAGESVDDMNKRVQSGLDSFLQAVGGPDFVVQIPGQEIVAAAYTD